MIPANMINDPARMQQLRRLQREARLSEINHTELDARANRLYGCDAALLTPPQASALVEVLIAERKT